MNEVAGTASPRYLYEGTHTLIFWEDCVCDLAVTNPYKTILTKTILRLLLKW